MMNQVVQRPGKFYSPFRYPGGKASLTKFLSNTIDVNNLGGCKYIEPFAGGAGAALSLLILEKVDRIIINDLDNAIYSFWHLLITNHYHLIDRIKGIDVSIEEWHRQKDIYQNPKSNWNDLGFATFYLNRTNHSGIIGGRPIGGFEQKSKWGINARFNKKNLISRIEKIAAYKSRIQVSNKDGIELMEELRDERKHLLYIDPPYYVKGSSLYLNHYENNDHRTLATFLNNNSDSSWILTYDNVPEISELYSHRKKTTFSINYSANQHKEGKELLIYSDNIELP